MRWSRRRYDGSRIPRFESVEPRLLLSGDPVADFWIDYYLEEAVVDEVGAALADAHDLTGLDQARADYGFTGSGQTVAVIDSGIAYEHYALGGGFGPAYRVVGGFDFTERDADPHDDGPAGWDQAFTLDVTKELVWGKRNQITVRAMNTAHAGGIWKPVLIEVLK